MLKGINNENLIKNIPCGSRVIFTKRPIPKKLILTNGFQWPGNIKINRYAKLIQIPHNTPTKRSDAQPLVEREKQFECLPVEISRS